MELPRDATAVVELGYEGLCSAARLRGRDVSIHVGVVVPGNAFGDDWTVVETAAPLSAAGIEDMAERTTTSERRHPTREAAEADLLATLGRRDLDVVHPGYLVQGVRRDGAPAWIGIDAREGWPMFADRYDDALVLASARTARDRLRSVPSMRTYYRGDAMEMDSFRVHECETETRRVRIDEEARRRLREEKVGPPEGWRFAACDATQSRFVVLSAAMTGSGVAHAIPFRDLAEALAAADGAHGEGGRVVLVRRRVAERPLDDEALRLQAEREAALPRKEPVLNLEDVGEFRPF